MRNRSTLVATLLAVVAMCLIFASVNDAQIVVERAGGGGFAGPANGIFQVLNQLADEKKWEEARDQLVKMAKEGKRFDVIFNLDSFKQFRQDAVLQERYTAVFDKLKEEGLYPINSKDIQGMVEQARTTLAKIEQQNKEGECPMNAVRMLHSTTSMLENCSKMIENPESSRSGGTMGGVRRAGR